LSFGKTIWQVWQLVWYFRAKAGTAPASLTERSERASGAAKTHVAIVRKLISNLSACIGQRERLGKTLAARVELENLH
jgi:hypothetical protein